MRGLVGAERLDVSGWAIGWWATDAGGSAVQRAQDGAGAALAQTTLALTAEIPRRLAVEPLATSCQAYVMVVPARCRASASAGLRRKATLTSASAPTSEATSNIVRFRIAGSITDSRAVQTSAADRWGEPPRREGARVVFPERGGR